MNRASARPRSASCQNNQALRRLHGRHVFLFLKRSKLLCQALPGSLECSLRDERPDSIGESFLHRGKVPVSQECDDLLCRIHPTSVLA
jgi:hypothetical protein